MTRSDPVVDHDHRLARQCHRGFRPAVFELAPLDLFELPLDFAVDVVVLDAEGLDHFLVEDGARMVAINHRADSQFRLTRRAELAHDHDIEGCPESLDDLARHGQAATWNGKHDHSLVLVGGQRAASIRPASTRFEKTIGWPAETWTAGALARWRTNHSLASLAACSSVPASSNRWVAPGTICSDFSQRRARYAFSLSSITP